MKEEFPNYNIKIEKCQSNIKTINLTRQLIHEVSQQLAMYITQAGEAGVPLCPFMYTEDNHAFNDTASVVSYIAQTNSFKRHFPLNPATDYEINGTITEEQIAEFLCHIEAGLLKYLDIELGNRAQQRIEVFAKFTENAFPFLVEWQKIKGFKDVKQ